MNKTRLIHCFDAGPAHGLAKAEFARRFHYWRGKSGDRRLFTVFSPASTPDYEGVVMVLARADEAGRVPLWVGLSDGVDIPVLAARKGATEVHLHLMATEIGLRQALLSDLFSLSGHDEPLIVEAL